MPGIEVLAAVPGISSRTARVLLEPFGSVAGLLDAGPERWAEVDGIGTVRAHSLAVALLNGDARNGSPLSPARRVWRGSSVP
jgi:ERCC4-type nuclease